MDFNEVIAELNSKAVPDLPAPSPAELPLMASDLPGNMPLTNRLDKMTVEQARWAIQNGTAWIAYLKANDGEIYQPDAKNVEVSDADKCQAIYNTLARVWLDLTENMKREHLRPDQDPVWVDALQWAVSVIPDCYKKQREIIHNELEEYRTGFAKTKNEGE